MARKNASERVAFMMKWPRDPNGEMMLPTPYRKGKTTSNGNTIVGRDVVRLLLRTSIAKLGFFVDDLIWEYDREVDALEGGDLRDGSYQTG